MTRSASFGANSNKRQLFKNKGSQQEEVFWAVTHRVLEVAFLERQTSKASNVRISSISKLVTMQVRS